MKLSAQCITIIPLDHHELTSDDPWPLLAVYSALSTATKAVNHCYNHSKARLWSNLTLCFLISTKNHYKPLIMAINPGYWPLTLVISHPKSETVPFRTGNVPCISSAPWQSGASRRIWSLSVPWALDFGWLWGSFNQEKWIKMLGLAIKNGN